MPSPLPDTSRQALREAMTAYAGVVRDEAGLTTLINQIDQMKDQTGAANELITARLIAQAALARTESRGAHAHSDFPERNDAEWMRHTLWYSEGNRLDYKPVNLKPLTVETFQPKKRTF